MATNGNSSTTNQQLETLEAALTGAPQRGLDPVDWARDPMVTRSNRGQPAAAEVASDDVVARVDAAAELCREVGRYASDHGRYLNEISTAFAEKLQAMTKEYAANMLAAEERKMAELRRILGKIAG